ncbi:NAD-glutamate dehydrogenase [Candidatus Tisiphia endosymbiont of Nemotelus uliginosus]|uniref:NAD-glutamate dehydrogenase n=1 Tax=Candidatus Tisiphia endosymbiont of Nemotelus uliginosus TaxID=3077926 RepID=UPI0035C8B801
MTFEKTSLALSKLTCQVPNYKHEILMLSKLKTTDELYSEFVQKFLEYIPIDYEFKDRQQLFGNLAEDAFKFFKQRTPNTRKMQIVNSIVENNPAINILLLNDNKPFIIDSINCLLIKLNLKAKFLLNSVISNVRDERGQLQKIIKHEKDSTHVESLVHITLLGNFDQPAILSLRASLNMILDQVDTTYNVWHIILDKIDLIIKAIQSKSLLYTTNHLADQESLDFLNWLKYDNFTFLGMIDFDLITQNFLSEIGVNTIWEDNQAEIINIIKRSTHSSYREQLIILGKTNIISNVHKNNLVDYILIKNIDQNGQYISGSIIFGLYSITVYYQPITNIPILRQKLQFVLNKAAFPPNGYNIKKLKNIVQTLPRDALIQIDENDLYCMCLNVLSGLMSKKLKLFIQQDWSGTFLNIIIFLTRDRLTPEIHSSINSYLSTIFKGKILEDYITEVAENFSYLFITLQVSNIKQISFEFETIEQELDRISTRWEEDFAYKLSKKFGEYEGGINFTLYHTIFSADYREKFNGQTGVLDIEYLKEASLHNKSIFNLIPIDKENFCLKIYNPAASELALSDLLPPIENLGFKAIDEQSFFIREAGDIKESWIYEFALTALIPIEENIQLVKKNVEEALDKMATGVLANDSLSKLIVLSGFNWWQVKLVKALTRYLHQTGFAYGKGYVQLTLTKHFLYTKMLVDLFEAKFDPINYSEPQVKSIKINMINYLNSINSSSEDKVLRTMIDIIDAMVRTNCYQASPDSGKLTKNYFSFKFDSHKIPNLPLPIPLAEIFVYANDFEGIHLRGGKVARGGIRWSDRGEDYRTEILGLMKAQMTKNSVIVPVGSKGGFFVNFTNDNLTAQAYLGKVIECYQNFLRGLLDITDNIVDSKIVHPQDTIIYDLEDPYLVVAADKGTATFSDYANRVAAEYNFWLGDAFASGGSAGYDHKKMAITAKGAWISVANHFDTLNINVQQDPITVVGIGDMSGDVFGNGMLRSNSIKLIAAFNHKHIFIDPNPDPIISFNERKRLFALPASNWTDYNQELISVGGGVFERSTKSITLSLEARTLLKIAKYEISPEELIKAILQVEVDLLWNGGIGTYIKATTENNLEIGDKANDNLRVNGNQIKAKVIAEGGNIGISQQGRIEYSQHGGKINTDFIDNSAGVDCSDHEVNIKIALNQAVASGKITIPERNKYLVEMTEQVEELVLIDNQQQNQALNIMQLSPALNIGIFSQFIDTLEEANLIDRKIEFLPTTEELNKRAINKEIMTRPELCVILSYSKSSTYHDLMTTTFSQDKYFESYLINYFPKLMQDKFRDEILSHPLKHEIIRTVVTNKIINQLGGPSLNIVKRETEALLCNIIRSYTIICEIFDLDNLWKSVELLPREIDYKVKIEMFTEIAKIMRRGIAWFAKHIATPINISNTINEFYKPARELSTVVGSLLLGEAKSKFDEKLQQYIAYGVGNELANKLSTLDSLVSVFDIIYIAKKTNSQNIEVANLYFATSTKFSIDWLRKVCEQQAADTYWGRLSAQSLKDDLYDKQRQLLIKIINNSKISVDLDSWIDNNKHFVSIFLDFVTLIKAHQNTDLNMLILANKRFDTFLRKLE